MSILNLTPARLDLLRAVERGEVEHVPSWGLASGYARRVDAARVVTLDVETLMAAGLVARPRYLFADPPFARWTLTDDGRKALQETGS